MFAILKKENASKGEHVRKLENDVGNLTRDWDERLCLFHSPANV